MWVEVKWGYAVWTLGLFSVCWYWFGIYPAILVALATVRKV